MRSVRTGIELLWLSRELDTKILRRWIGGTDMGRSRKPPRGLGQHDSWLNRLIRLAYQAAGIQQRIADVRMKVDTRHVRLRFAARLLQCIIAMRGRSGTATAAAPDGPLRPSPRRSSRRC